MAANYGSGVSLENDIFGGNDSELSDIEDVEAPRSSAAASASEDEGPAGDQDYVQPAGTSQAGAAKKKAPRAAAAGEPKRKRPKKPSGQQAAVDDEPEPEMTPEERRRKELDDRLDAIIKKPKAKKRKRAADEEDLGQAADEDEIYRLRKTMGDAFKADNDAITAGQPALNRLKMLPKVEATLQKAHLELIALDQNILLSLRDWLEPAANKSLPSLNIQRSIFAILNRMNIETVALKESGIGKVVTFYSRCPRVETSIRRNADNLITAWMRPILRRSSAWRDKQRRRHESTLAPGMQDSATGRRHARIPQAVAATYTVAPANRIDRGAIGANNKEAMERFRQLNRQVKGAKAAQKRL